MGELSRFFGITVSIYKERDAKHKKPHVHVYYSDSRASYDLKGNLLSGGLPRTQRKLVEAWILIHEKELLRAWNDSIGGKSPDKIEPLRLWQEAL